MNLNKKTLSSKTNNSPWLLCPSKSFPGKFYYFNGSTGETAWSLNDSDHNNLNKDAIHRVEDIAHPYAEPFGPPTDENTNTSSSSMKKDIPSNINFNNATKFNGLSFSSLSNFNKGTKFNNQTNFSDRMNFSLGSNLNGASSFGIFNKPPYFPAAKQGWGQPVFPTYLKDKAYPSKVVWTLTPMLVNEESFQMFDPIAQYNSPDMFLHNPVHNIFQPFNSPQTNPFYKVNPCTTGVQMGKPLFSTKVRYKSKDVQTFDPEPLTKEEACQTFEPDKEPIPTEPLKPVLQPSKFGVKLSCKSDEKSTREKVDNVMEIDKTNKLFSLKENDLRFLLDAKRRKSIDSGEGQKPIKDTAISQSKENTPIKRVTFKLGDIKADGDISENAQKPISFSPTKEVFQYKPKISYLVPDSEVLIANYQYIEKYVIGVDNCHLLIPFAVKSMMETISRGECRGGRDIFAARYVLRKLTAPTPNVIIQRNPEDSISSEQDSILDCCWQYSQDSHLSLLTNNTELIEKAETIGINCCVFDPIRQQIVPVESAKLATDALNTINNKPSTNKNVETLNLFEVTQTDLADLGISKLEIGDDRINQIELINKIHDKENKTDMERNAKNEIKISGITKLNSVFNIDEELARYYVKNEVMEQRLASRSDEWVCRLIQAMEGSLNDVLLKEKVTKNMPPKDLHELVQNIGNTFKKHTKIRCVVDGLLTHLKRNVTKFSKVKPVDFVKLLGFCMILVQSLKEILDYKELCDADDLLSELLKHIEDHNTDVELSIEKASTPVLSDAELETKVPVGYRKKQSNVIEYLRKHFPGAFLSENEVKAVPKIVRTVGKDLNSIKVFNTKDIVMNNTNNVKRNVEPEIVKKFTVIEAFEARLKKQTELDTYDDYEESLSTVLSDPTFILNDKSPISKENSKKRNILSSSDDTDHLVCGIESECIYACPLMKAFLSELRTTFVMIFNFVSDTMQDDQTPLPDNGRSELDLKIHKAYNYIIQIVNRLTSIIARESGSGITIRMLLIRAGDYEEENETMSHYKELIAKYLEQAKILADALQLLLAIRNEQHETGSIIDTPSSS